MVPIGLVVSFSEEGDMIEVNELIGDDGVWTANMKWVDIRS